MVRSSLLHGLILTGALGALGCRDLDRFDTKDGEAYCGSMVSAAFIHDGFVPKGVPPDIRLRLKLDIDNLSTYPGTISTDDADRGLCSSNTQPLFNETKLRAIEQVQNDALGLLEFGDGREHNFLAWADSSCQGTVLSVVSLMKNDDVEVRLLKPAPEPPPDADPANRPGFILFHLTRQSGTCGF